MNNDRLNDLLQGWAATRIKNSSKKLDREERLRKIRDRISEKAPPRERKRAATEPEPGFPSIRKKPASADRGDLDDRIRRGKFA